VLRVAPPRRETPDRRAAVGAMADFLPRRRRTENVAAVNGEISVLRESLSWDPESLPASSWNRNAPFVAWIVELLEPRCTLELGCGDGASFRGLCQAIARFSNGGICVGIDQWRTQGRNARIAEARYETLREFCEVRYAQVASLRRADLSAAAEQFPVHSVDLLHVAPQDPVISASLPDLTIWASKVRPGGLILVSRGVEDDADDGSRKAWLALAEAHPSVVLRLARPLGVVQVAEEGVTPLVDFLSSHTRTVTALFNCLGERVEFRHVLHEEPTSTLDIRKDLARMLSEHAQEVRRLEAVHRAERQSLEERLSATSDQLLKSMFKVNELEGQTNLLLAKLAHYSDRHARELGRLSDELEALRHRYHGDIAELQRQLAARDAEIGAIHATKSWRLTKPLRAAQRSARWLRRVGR